MRVTTSFSVWGSITAMVLAASAQAQDVKEIVGLNDLLERLGDTAPTGAGVEVSQVEAPNGDGEYGPDQENPEFNGKTFEAMSGPPGETGHATGVGRNMYGLVTSVAPGVDTVYLYEANHWVQTGYLKSNYSGSVPPADTPGEVKSFNNSWIGTFGVPDNDNKCLRRADFVVLRDQLIITSGVNNGGSSYPLMSHLFNSLAVGLRQGGHCHVNTLPSYDGPGRMKPEIVSPASDTSTATPIVNAAGSLMVDTARTWPGLESNQNAERSEVLKAALLCGAKHEDAHGAPWTNNPVESGPDRGITSQPIDDVVGAGTVNVNRSHFIMTGLERDGTAMPPDEPSAGWTGWDLATVGLGESRYWRIYVHAFADDVAILATWHRQIGQFFLSWKLADFDLILWRVNEEGELVTLVGDEGLPYFDGGNVVSESAVDNIELLSISGLQPGEYVIELQRLDDIDDYPDWDVALAWLFPERPEDINIDGVVDVVDLLALLAAWGDCPGCPEDINEDGVVNTEDLLALLGAWG